MWKCVRCFIGQLAFVFPGRTHVWAGWLVRNVSIGTLRRCRDELHRLQTATTGTTAAAEHPSTTWLPAILPMDRWSNLIAIQSHTLWLALSDTSQTFKWPPQHCHRLLSLWFSHRFWQHYLLTTIITSLSLSFSIHWLWLASIRIELPFIFQWLFLYTHMHTRQRYLGHRCHLHGNPLCLSLTLKKSCVWLYTLSCPFNCSFLVVEVCSKNSKHFLSYFSFMKILLFLLG